MIKIKSKIQSVKTRVENKTRQMLSKLPIPKSLGKMKLIESQMEFLKQELDREVNRREILEQRIYRGIDEIDRDYTQLYDLMYTRHGILRSTKSMSPELKFDANQFFQIQEKARVALTTCSMWRGGDYFEFGSSDMNTFRNFLSAFDIFDLKSRFPNTQFYAFDIFGAAENDNELLNDVLNSYEGLDNSKSIQEEKATYVRYFDHFKKNGNQYEMNMNRVKEHGLYLDQCHLIQGYFENTLNPEFKAELKKQKREIGFAFLDCNIAAPYKIVFEFIFDLIAPLSYIYMDEYYVTGIPTYFDQFVEALGKKRNIIARHMCNAGGFGALFFLCPDTTNVLRKLDL